MKNKFSIAMSLAVVLAMLLTSLALADNVENDVVSTPASITLEAGVSTSYVDVQFWIQANSSDGDPQCNFDSTSESVTFTVNTPSGVTANPSSLTFNKCKDGGNNNAQAVRFSASGSATSGNISFTQTANNSGGSFSYVNAVFNINVVTPPPANTVPSLNLPGNITAEATSAAGVVVNYTASATDAEDNPDPTPSCSPASGSTFPLGTTTVNCSVTDSGGLSDSGSFSVTVRDTTAPTVTVLDITAEATGPSGAVVSFTASANDLVDGSITPTCSSASGSTFPLGTTTVNCSAIDAAGNTDSASFSVSVVDTTPPIVNVPADMTVEATGPAGAVASFSASASDLVDGTLTATCSPASGATFPLGATSVTCSATDGAGNAGNKSFTVTVVDTTAPQLTLPSNMTVSATSAAGAVVTFTASANDLVDGSVAVTCTPSSGSTFAPGTTTVNCTATDAAGNSASGSFTVTVKFQLLGFYQPVDMTPAGSPTVWNTVKNGSTVPLKFEVFAGSTELSDTSLINQPLKATQQSCSGGTTDDIELLATGATSLRYDATAGQFIYNWQTPKKAGFCYIVTVATADGSSLTAYFRLK